MMQDSDLHSHNNDWQKQVIWEEKQEKAIMIMMKMDVSF